MTARKLSRVHFTSKEQDWGTPQAFFDAYHAAFKFTVDACAEPGNAKLKRYWSPEDDGLSFSWVGERVFLNPPYKHAAEWTRKARAEAMRGAFVVGLVPARTSEAWFQDNVLAPDAGAFRGSDVTSEGVWTRRWSGLTIHLRFIAGRLKFEKPGKSWTAPFPSAVVIWEHPTSAHGLFGLRALDALPF